MILTSNLRYLILFVSMSCFLQACGTGPAETASDNTGGEELARAQCGTCHLYPEPSLLDAERWARVLPYMGHRLGIYGAIGRDSLIRQSDLRGIDTAAYFPEQPVISQEDWEVLETFYLDAAPDEMPPVRRPREMSSGLAHFEARVPALRFDPPLTILTQIQPENKLMYLGNYGAPSTLGVINAAGAVLFDWDLTGVPVRAHWDNGRLYILQAGPGPEPTEAREGAIVLVEGPASMPRTIMQGLKRPMDMELADLNGDEVNDFVICEYGHQAGLVSAFLSTGDGQFERQVLSEMPGGIQAAVHDFDGNGTPDIAVLMAQGDEGIDIYYNDGAGVFSRERILRFPPVYGSNDLQLADFNQDGRMDLLYVNGDNADITPVVKAYHGLRIYLADDAGGFEEAAFFALPGAVSARAGDFDADGDLDIAAISYFPDYQHAPEEGFVYLENTGGLVFQGHTMFDAQRGRWLTMDAGDLDGDSDLDILIGSNIGFGPQGDTTGLYGRWAKDAPSFVLLENKIR